MNDVDNTQNPVADENNAPATDETPVVDAPVVDAPEEEKKEEAPTEETTPAPE